MSRFTVRDPAFAGRVERSFARQTLMGTLGVTLLAVRPGEVEVGLAIAPHILQHHGFVHGGVVTTLADTAAGFAALTLMEAGFGILTVEFKVNLLVPARGHRLVAEGRVLRPGRTLTVLQATVFSEADGGREAVALLTGTMMRVGGRANVVD